MKYGLYDRPPAGTSILSALQWMIVAVSSSVAVPLMIGDVYGLKADEIGNLMQQTMFFVGLASLLQVWIGHRYPMLEGLSRIVVGNLYHFGSVGNKRRTGAA